MHTCSPLTELPSCCAVLRSWKTCFLLLNHTYNRSHYHRKEKKNAHEIMWIIVSLWFFLFLSVWGIFFIIIPFGMTTKRMRLTENLDIYFINIQHMNRIKLNNMLMINNNDIMHAMPIILDFKMFNNIWFGKILFIFHTFTLKCVRLDDANRQNIIKL